MRTVLLSRLYFRRGIPLLLRLSKYRLTSPWRLQIKEIPRRGPVISRVVMAALAPAAFLKLAEDTGGHDKTSEMNMLEVSRDEIRKAVSPHSRGLKKLCQSLGVFWYDYIYDPIATSCRFLHLVVIFMPVIITFPVIWLGRSVGGQNGGRSGTLWWYRFLVKAMERAGPAFIKVCF